MAARALLRTSSLTRLVAVRSYSTSSAGGSAVHGTTMRKAAVPNASPLTANARTGTLARPPSNNGSAEATPKTPTVTPNEPDPFLDELPQGLPTDWSRSYHGLSTQAFPKEVADILLAPLEPMDVEIKPDGILYLPEIKYRRIMNRAFGPGGWGLAPRGETHVGAKIVSREYALVCHGRLVAIARGEQEYFEHSGIATATEGCKSNALMRCAKDLGIASELWDPRFIREFKAEYCIEVFAEHVTTKKRKKLWRRKDQPKLDYPFKET